MYIFGTQQSVLNTEVSLFQGYPLRGVPLHLSVAILFFASMHSKYCTSELSLGWGSNTVTSELLLGWGSYTVTSELSLGVGLIHSA